MKVLLSLCLAAVVIAIVYGATCPPPDKMDEFRCYPYKHDAVCMSDHTYICGNCFAEEKECRTNHAVKAILNEGEASRICTGAKPLCLDTEKKHLAKYMPRRTASGQWI